MPRGCKAGYSILEMMIVLAIIALAAAIVFPRGAAMTSRVTAGATAFDFQRRVLDLRRQAYQGQAAVTLFGTGAAPAGDSAARTIALGGPWTYRLDRPLRISEGGDCSGTQVELLNGGRTAMRLASPGGCRFSRAG